MISRVRFETSLNNVLFNVDQADVAQDTLPLLGTCTKLIEFTIKLGQTLHIVISVLLARQTGGGQGLGVDGIEALRKLVGKLRNQARENRELSGNIRAR